MAAVVSNSGNCSTAACSRCIRPSSSPASQAPAASSSSSPGAAPAKRAAASNAGRRLPCGKLSPRSQASDAPLGRRRPERDVYAPLRATISRGAASLSLPSRRENGVPRPRIPGADALAPITTRIRGGHFHGTVRGTFSLDIYIVVPAGGGTLRAGALVDELFQRHFRASSREPEPPAGVQDLDPVDALR